MDHSDYSYIRLNYRLVINRDGSITHRMDEDEAVQAKVYKEFFRKSNAIVLSDTDGLSNGNGIYANRNAFDYLSCEIKELKGLSLDKDIYFLVPKQWSGNAAIIDSLKESVRFFEGDQFTYDYDIVYYEEDVELISIEVNLFNSSQFQKNPLIVYNNLSADKIENQVVDKERGVLQFTDEIMFKITDDEFNRFVQENGLTGEIVKKTNVLDKYNHSWNVAKRVLIINFIFSMLVLFLEFIIITLIIKLEYEVNAIELSIKKVLGHSMLAKNSKIILMTLITTLFPEESLFCIERRKYMITIKDLTKTFEDKVVFSNFNLTIEDGDFVIFSGPSGCGKTTLLNMIGAIEQIEKGSILVDGMDIKVKKNHLLYFRQKIGFLFQNFALVDNKTVKENLKLIRKDCQTDLSIEDALRIVGLEDKLNKKVYTLSGGEQQRIALARLMLKNATLFWRMNRLALWIKTMKKRSSSFRNLSLN